MMLNPATAMMTQTNKMIRKSFIILVIYNGIQNNGLMKKVSLVVFLPIRIFRYSRRAIDIIMAVNGPAFVTVKPCSVTSKREENGQRDVCVIPHEFGMRGPGTRSLPLPVLTWLNAGFVFDMEAARGKFSIFNGFLSR